MLIGRFQILLYNSLSAGLGEELLSGEPGGGVEGGGGQAGGPGRQLQDSSRPDREHANHTPGETLFSFFLSLSLVLSFCSLLFFFAFCLFSFSPS